MQASTAVEQIFKQAGWASEQAKLNPATLSSSNSAYEQVLKQANQAYRVVLDSVNLDLAVFNNQEVFLGIELMQLPSKEQIEERQSLVRKASTMVALVNLDHKLKLSLQGDSLCLERVIGLEQEEEPIRVVELFLDDCDFFVQHIKQEYIASANTNGANSAQLEQSQLAVSQLSPEQLSQMSASLQYFMGVAP